MAHRLKYGLFLYHIFCCCQVWYHRKLKGFTGLNRTPLKNSFTLITQPTGFVFLMAISGETIFDGKRFIPVMSIDYERSAALVKKEEKQAGMGKQATSRPQLPKHIPG